MWYTRQRGHYIVESDAIMTHYFLSSCAFEIFVSHLQLKMRYMWKKTWHPWNSCFFFAIVMQICNTKSSYCSTSTIISFSSMILTTIPSSSTILITNPSSFTRPSNSLITISSSTAKLSSRLTTILSSCSNKFCSTISS